MNCPILSVITFLPLLGAIILLFINGEKQERIKRVALAIAFIDFVLSLPLFFMFKLDTAEFQFVREVPWIKEFGINYHVGIDGISLFLFLLTSFLSLICILASWNIKDRIKEYMIAMLILQTGMLGVFISLDLFLFYVFWELMLIPDVPVNWCLGRPPEDLCYNKVFRIYNGRKRIDAGCHIGPLFQVLQRDGRIHI